MPRLAIMIASELHTIDGATIALRPVGRRDREQLSRGFERLSFESRRRRFLAAVSRLPPQQLDALCTADGRGHVAVVAVELDDRGRERSGVGIAHSIRDPATPDLAEFAITVVDEWQGRGVGKLLARALMEEARQTGVRRWRAVMLADNRSVQHVLAHVAHETGRRSLGDGVIEIVYSLPRRDHQGSSDEREARA